MTAKEAYEALKKAYPNMKATSCCEYSKYFTFAVVPKDYDSDVPVLFNGYSVDKATGEIKIFSPIQITVEEYRKRKKITDFE